MRSSLRVVFAPQQLLLRVLVWSTACYCCCFFVRAFPLDLFNAVLATTAQDEFGKDEQGFNDAIDWQTRRVSTSGVAAPFIGCADYHDGRQLRVRLENMVGVDSVRTVHHSRQHGSSCFIFHAVHDGVEQLLRRDGSNVGTAGQLQQLAAFPANLKISPTVLDYSAAATSSARTRTRRSVAATNSDRQGPRRLSMQPRGAHPTSRSTPTRERLADKLDNKIYDGQYNLHAPLTMGGKGLTTAERMQKKLRFYSSPYAQGVDFNMVDAEGFRPKATINYINVAGRGGEVSSDLRVNSHPHMHIMRSRGLGLQLSPGALGPLPQHTSTAQKGDIDAQHPTSIDTDMSFKELVDGWREAWASPSMDLHRLSMWSDPEAGFQVSDGAGDVVQKVFRSSEWRRAADKLEQMRGNALDRDGLGKSCGWDMAIFSRETADYITVTGIDHLLDGDHLPKKSEWTQDRRVACLMGLLSVFTSAHEVLRITPLPRARIHNAVASAIAQSGNITRRPLHDEGLDGTGEVVQVVDTGLDELSCFFVDHTGEIEHGTIEDPVSDLERRKVVQYIEYGVGDEGDMEAGHGTHVASSIVGDIFPGWEPVECSQGEQKDCFAVCRDADEMEDKAKDWEFDASLYCKALDCDGWLELQTAPVCLKDEPAEAPVNARGVASGAKIALFDVSGDDDESTLDVPFPDARPVWIAAASTGAAIHSNSWGYQGCFVNEAGYYGDKFLFDHPSHILLFAAGNSGNQGLSDGCTIDSPATSKNALAVGSSSSGVTRFSPNVTIDEVSAFSGRGPLDDGRIKPDVVAPGDMVISARSAGYDGGETCEVEVKDGTSMSNAVAAGAAAIVRQYFREGWYTEDVTARGLCSDGMLFNCKAAGTFNPSGALLKAVLIHGGESMGGLSPPNGDRGFGRVFLEDVLSIRGEGATAMYFDDEVIAEAGKTIDYVVTVANSTVELRATLVWMDPPVLSFAGRQLVHDLDLVVLPSASGSLPIFSNGLASCCDMVNNVERVVVPAELASAAAAEMKEYTIRIVAYQLIEADHQAFSLIVSGGSLNVTSVTTVDTTDDYLFGKTAPPTPAPLESQVGSCGVADSYGWIGDGWCDGIMNNEDCLWDGGDCCIDSCVDGQYDCDRSIFNCKDPDSAFSHFCGVTSDNDGQSGATLYSEDLTTIESETRAHVCANCNPIMENFFHTIGDGSCDSWANVETCAFDGGDCCSDTCQHDECSGASENTCFDPSSSLSYCGSLDTSDLLYEFHEQLCRECASFSSNLGSFIGDGFCDTSLEFNTAGCLFDGGDCCLDTCKDALWICPENNYEEEYVCLDPSSSEYLCDHIVDYTNRGESLCETCAEYMDPDDRFDIGDGHCNDDKNTAGCLWDGGDCCQSSCQPDSPLFIEADPTAAPTSSPTAAPSSSPSGSPTSSFEGFFWPTESTSSSSTTPTATPIFGWSARELALAPNAPICDRAKPTSSIFECLDCGGEARMYAIGQVVCLDPYSPEYVCAQGVSDTQRDLCESCDHSFASDWYLVGNGGCQTWLNTEGCLWDGGDCCESTCVAGEDPTGQTCGIFGYDCLEPDAE